MTGALYLTDGTTRINLLTGIDGFRLMNWTPVIPPAKQTWRDSPLSDGRKLAMSKFANATETFSLRVSRFTQDDIINDLQELRRLLLAAREYFIGGSDIPVWIEAKGDCETNTRYAVVCDWRAETDDDPYRKPFLLDHPVVDGFTLVIERQHWRDVAPGSSTCVQLSATQDYYDEQTGEWVTRNSDDDAYGTPAPSFVLNTNLRFGDDGAGNLYSCGMRFDIVNIPQFAYIIRAWVSIHADANLAANTCRTLLACENADDPAAFTTWANFAARARAGAYGWQPGAFVAGTNYDSATFAASLQAVVNRAGWVSGNHVVVFIDNNASDAGAYRTIDSFDTGTPPVLHAWYFDAHTRTFGRTATCLNEVYVANKHNIAQLTHIYVDDGGVFGANLIGAALPFDFLPAVPAVNDAVYFGIATGVLNSGPFCSLVFDILASQTQVTTITWQYWNGAWVALTVRDNTNANGAMTGDPFDTTGVNSVHWEQPSDWVTTAINGVTGYWVRTLVGAIGGAPTPPTQQNRDIYTVITPYVDTLAAQVTGDIQALAEKYITAESGRTAVDLCTTRVFAGLRSYNRGSLFTSYLNLSDEQNQAGVTVTVNGGSATFAAAVQSPTGRVVNWTTGGAAAEAWLTYITLSSSLVSHFAGKFRCFLRYNASVVGGTSQFRLQIAQTLFSSATYRTNLSKSIMNGNPFYVDFGTISLPGIAFESNDSYNSLILVIYGVTTAAVNANLLDIVLLPVDECFVEAGYIPIAGTGLGPSESILNYDSYGPKRLDVNSTIPRRFIISNIENVSTGHILSGWNTNNANPLAWQPNERQRWWYFFKGSNVDPPEANHEISNSIQAFQVSRYLSMRGNR